MRRHPRFATMVVLAGLMWSTGPGAQTYPGVVPPVPSPGGGPPPPAIAPGRSGIAPGPAGPLPSGGVGRIAPGLAAPGGGIDDDRGVVAPSGYGRGRVVTVPGLPPVLVPGGLRGRDSYSDRVERCVHYGTAAGVPSNEIGRFTAQCAH